MYWKVYCDVSLLLPSVQIEWFIQAMPRCCAAARHSFNSSELNYHVNHSKWTRAVIMKQQRVVTIGVSLKYFASKLREYTLLISHDNACKVS